MAEICIKCPSTGVTVSTGQDIEPEQFESADLGMSTFQCSACDEVHTWNRRDAFLKKDDAA